MTNRAKNGVHYFAGEALRELLEQRRREGYTEEEENERLVIVLKIGDAIKRRGVSQKAVAERTGIRPAAISQLARGYVDRLTLDHLEKIARALQITDIRELIDLELESEAWNYLSDEIEDDSKQGE